MRTFNHRLHLNEAAKKPAKKGNTAKAIADAAKLEHLPGYMRALLGGAFAGAGMTAGNGRPGTGAAIGGLGAVALTAYQKIKDAKNQKPTSKPTKPRTLKEESKTRKDRFRNILDLKRAEALEREEEKKDESDGKGKRTKDQEKNERAFRELLRKTRED